MSLPDLIPKALLVDTVRPKKGSKTGEVDIVPTIIDVKTPDMEIGAGFISKFPKQMILLRPFKYVRATVGDGFERVQNSCLRISFKSFRFNVKNSHLLQYILDSKIFGTARVNIDPEDPGGFWQKQGWLKKKTIQVLESTTVPTDAAKVFDIKKVIADPKPEPEKTESATA